MSVDTNGTWDRILSAWPPLTLSHAADSCPSTTASPHLVTRSWLTSQYTRVTARSCWNCSSKWGRARMRGLGEVLRGCCRGSGDGAGGTACMQAGSREIQQEAITR